MTKEERRRLSAKRYREANREKLRNLNRAWKQRNKERVREYARQHRKDNPEYYRNLRRTKYLALTPEQRETEYQKTLARLRRKHGFTGTMFEDRLKEQDGLCAICRTRNGTAADHNHTSGKARGVLCSQCNHFIGLAQESIPVLLSAVGYLQKWAEG